jgi:lipid II:glycine glycyltransferase (peptidoglycan interpeptide bridge formation enzyme)
MKPKGRYNIKVAEKHNVKIIQAAGDQPSAKQLVTRVHKLYLETAKRDGFTPRSLEYFEDLIIHLKEKGRVMIAHDNTADLAGLILILHGGFGSYLYGASSSVNRQAMAPYLLHWSAMQIAKEHNCQVYDLLAVAPVDQPNHPYAGLSRFKTQFGGETVHLLGSFDLILQPIRYKLFSLAEKIRRKK